MDCCANDQKENTLKGGNKPMEISKKTLLWIVIAVLLLIVLYMTFQSPTTTANVVQSASASASKSAASYGGMVGGC